MTFNERYKDNIILIKSFEFSKNIIEFAECLERERKFEVANQLIKSGTSNGANVKEAQNGESKKDFIHKLKIALKEADETEYWLFLCDEMNTYPDCKKLSIELETIIKILNKIISSSTIRLNNSKSN